MPKGRPSTDIAENLRRKIWYFNVAKRSGMSDYELDCEFDLIQNRSGQHRRRFFERLRVFNEMPFRGRTAEFVNLVDSHSKLNGTAKIYTSSFWDIVSTAPMNVESLRDLIIVGFRNLGLLNRPDSKSIRNGTYDVLNVFSANRNLTIPYNQAYQKAYKSVFMDLKTSLDSLAITGALYQEAYFATNLRIALFLEGAFYEQLDSVKKADWMPKEVIVEFISVATERILRISKAPNILPTEYLELFDVSENKSSPAGCFLAKHDERMGW